MEATVLPFITAGLMANEKCAVIAGEPRLNKIRRQLSAKGLDTAMLAFSGQLVLCEELMECPLSASAVNMIDSFDLGKSINPSLTVCGFASYRCVFAVTDFLCHLDGRALLEREVALSKVLAKLPATLLLLYDRRLMSETTTHDLIEIQHS